MFIVAVTNQKGGVGKTTTTYHLARAASLRGLRVLVIDLDPQGNLSDSLVELEDGQAGMADALSSRSECSLGDVIVPTRWDRVHLAPSGADALAAVRDELVTVAFGRERRLAEQLRQVEGSFDLVFIDCAPALDALTANALAAADGVLVITQSRLYSASGLAHLLEAVAAARAYYNPRLRIAGVLVNQHKARTRQGTHWLDELASACGERGLPLLVPPVPDMVAISDAAEAGLGLDEWPGISKDLVTLYDHHLAAVLTNMGEEAWA